MEDCIFCKIVKGETQTNIEYENDRVVVFSDVRPIAPIHFLLVPKQHIRDVRDIEGYIWDDIRSMVNKICGESKIDSFRLTTYAGQSELVPHVSFHFLAGEPDKKE